MYDKFPLTQPRFGGRRYSLKSGFHQNYSMVFDVLSSKSRAGLRCIQLLNTARSGTRVFPFLGLSPLPHLTVHFKRLPSKWSKPTRQWMQRWWDSTVGYGDILIWWHVVNVGLHGYKKKLRSSPRDDYVALTKSKRKTIAKPFADIIGSRVRGCRKAKLILVRVWEKFPLIILKTNVRRRAPTYPARDKENLVSL